MPLRCARALAGALLLACVSLLVSFSVARGAGSYTDNGATITDNKTRLIWQKNVATTRYGWAEAKTHCAGLGASLGGSGWRLPTVKELWTLVDETVAPPGPTIDGATFPATPNGSFWSSTPYAGDPTVAWSASFYEGDTNFEAIGTANYVRCVR